MTPTTNKEFLAAWDAGESVTTCNMGGMSDGYEACIHAVSMEMLRAMLENPFDYTALEHTENNGERQITYRDYADLIDGVIAVKNITDIVGPTGAQYGAARNIATVFIRRGYAGGVATIPKDRLINIRKTNSVIIEKYSGAVSV